MTQKTSSPSGEVPDGAIPCGKSIHLKEGTTENEFHECTCGATFSSIEKLRIHQHNVHDPDDIMFSEFGEPK